MSAPLGIGQPKVPRVPTDRLKTPGIVSSMLD